MRLAALLPPLFFVAAAAFAQEAARPVEAPVHNLPMQKIGPHDLLMLAVTDSPELSRTFRVDDAGLLHLPMLKEPLTAAGVEPGMLERAIAAKLKASDLFVEPIVRVTVAEYHSRPISVAGAVKKPVTFQAITGATLLEAITRAEGLTELAGGEILVTRPGIDLPERISIRKLMEARDASLNLRLEGGEQIRVPEAERIFVAGNVRKPGAVLVREGDALSLLKLLALAEGLAPYASKQAYIYREGTAGKAELTVELAKIMKREMPDVPLEARDVVYVPDDTKRRAKMTVLDRITLFGSTAGATALIWRGR